MYSNVKKNILGTCVYYVGIGHQNKTNDYILLTKETMCPTKGSVKFRPYKISFHNTKGYGFSEYLSVWTTLPSLDDYKPENQPYKNKVSFAIGTGKGGANIAASYSISHNDLDITSSCCTPKSMYCVKYDYKPSIANPGSSNKYVSNESNQFGAAAFHTKKKRISIKMHYDARFGVADDAKRSPWLIYIDKIYRNTATRTFTFNLK